MKHAEAVATLGYQIAPWLPRVIVVFSVLIATLLIAQTYRVYNQTLDEAIHIATGLEWLDRGTYHYEPLHPPLARVFAAFGLYSIGVRTHGVPEANAEGNEDLESSGRYQRNLTLARMGILPFFWFACFSVWDFVKRTISDWHASIAVAALCCCPPVLAHAAVATTDVPLLAMFFVALARIWILLQEPTRANAMLAGLTIGLAIATKFTAIPYLLASCALLLACGFYRRCIGKIHLKNVVLVLALAVVTLWAVYRFSIGPIVELGSLRPDQVDMLRKAPKIVSAVLAFRWMPAHEFFRGLLALYSANLTGRGSYLLGHTYIGGRWAFFPVAILVKTPIPLLILSVLGLIFSLSRSRLRANHNIFLPIAGIAGPLAIAIFSNINIGLRHVLVIYPFIAMFAAIAVMELWKAQASQRWRFADRMLVLALLCWNAASCIAATPDFLPYFNEAAAPHASNILVDSDLDWGQDLFRLISFTQKEKIPSLCLAYKGSIDLARHSPPGWETLPPQTRVTGWIAISEIKLKLDIQNYGWLNEYKPMSEVGHSIRLYYLDKERIDSSK